MRQLRDRLSAITRFTFVVEQVARLNSSNASSFAEEKGSDSSHMDELDTAAPLRGQPSHISLGTPRSACCVGPHQPLPSQEAPQPHDVLLVSDYFLSGFANDIAFLDGPSPALLVASAYRVDLLDLASSSLALEPVPLGGLPYCKNFSLPNSTDLTVQPTVQAVAAWGGEWALVACHALHLFQAGALIPSQSYDLPFKVSCSGKEQGRVALTGSLVIAWRSCPGSTRATLLMATIPDTSSLPVAPTVHTLDIHAGACIACVSASSSLLAVGGSENCSAGGDVTLWQLSSGGVWLKRSRVVADPQLASTFDSSPLVHGCGFGRVVLLFDNLLFVGLPDAHGGEGIVALYDVSVPEAPELRCEWSPPIGVVNGARFGSTLAIRSSPEVPERLLLAVGMDGMVSVQQVYPEAGTWLAVCGGAILHLLGDPTARDLPGNEPVRLVLTPSAVVVGGITSEGVSAASSGATNRGLFVTSLCKQEHAICY